MERCDGSLPVERRIIFIPQLHGQRSLAWRVVTVRKGRQWMLWAGRIEMERLIPPAKEVDRDRGARRIMAIEPGDRRLKIPSDRDFLLRPSSHAVRGHRTRK